MSSLPLCHRVIYKRKHNVPRLCKGLLWGQGRARIWEELRSRELHSRSLRAQLHSRHLPCQPKRLPRRHFIRHLRGHPPSQLLLLIVQWQLFRSLIKRLKHLSLPGLPRLRPLTGCTLAMPQLLMPQPPGHLPRPSLATAQLHRSSFNTQHIPFKLSPLYPTLESRRVKLLGPLLLRSRLGHRMGHSLDHSSDPTPHLLVSW